ncbi:MAG: GtrA family protein [Oscillospiraceae bacterium]|nr:GtrA family protein [Oscillospiraceae bacterium]
MKAAREKDGTRMRRLLDRLPAWAQAPEFLRFVRYAAMGGLTTAVNLGVFVLLREALRWDQNLSNIIAVVVAVLFAYFTNKWFVFKTRCQNKRDLLREAASFFSGRAVTMAMEAGGFLLLDMLTGLPDFWKKAPVTVVAILLNYLFSKRFVFRKH